MRLSNVKRYSFKNNMYIYILCFLILDIDKIVEVQMIITKLRLCVYNNALLYFCKWTIVY